MSRISSGVFHADAGSQSTAWAWASIDHPGRCRIEDFIRRRFFVEYQARICHFLPELVCLTDTRGIHAAVGFSWALHRELYLEQYLVSPVEVTLRQATGARVGRGGIIEVGNLASSGPGGARAIILTLARYFHEQDAEWVVFTGIPSLLNTFSRLGIATHDLGEARPESLRDQVTDWGTYYASHPRVIGVSVPETYAHIAAHPVLARMMARMPRLRLEDGRPA